MSRNDTGESSAQIVARADDTAWPNVLAALREGATLRRPPKLTSYYIDRNGELGGGSLSKGRVRKLEQQGVLVHIGVDRYGAGNLPPVAAATELTAAGEQFVIPGCEKRTPVAKGSQLDLWGGKS